MEDEKKTCSDCVNHSGGCGDYGFECWCDCGGDHSDHCEFDHCDELVDATQCDGFTPKEVQT